jgi:hypothetical protein
MYFFQVKLEAILMQETSLILHMVVPVFKWDEQAEEIVRILSSYLNYIHAGLVGNGR